MSPDFDAPSDTRLTFTDARLKAIEPPKKGHVDYIDEGQLGLICRITATGKRIFHVYKWHKTDGPVRRRIGRLGVFSVSEARKEAREIVVRIEKGENPNTIDKSKRVERTVENWIDVWQKYHEEQHPNCRLKTVKSDVSAWERHILGRDKKTQKRGEAEQPLPVGLGSTKCRNFTVDDARKLHARITTNIGATIADEVVGLMSRLYRFAEIEPNPFKKDATGRNGVCLNGKKTIVRYLTIDTFRDLISALDKDDDQEVADLMRLALFTGQRRDNLRTMRWDEIDLHLALWRIPAEKFKTGKQADTPLPAMAVKLLKRRLAEREARGDKSAWVFPSRLDSGKPRTVMDRQTNRIFKRAGLGDWRFHDLRHACASSILLAGGTMAEAGRQLNHANAASTARYAHLDSKTVAKAADRGFEALAAPAKKSKGKKT